MVYRPHVHFVVPGGAISRDGRQWLSTPENFFLPGKALSRVYRGKLLDELVNANLIQQRSVNTWYRHDWVVDVKPVGNGHAVLKYLAPYVYRVAISNHRIERCDEQSVTYRDTPSGTKLTKTRCVEGPAFVRGFLQHVLPQSLQKVRYYGWMSPNHSRRLEIVKWLVWLTLGWTYYLKPMPAKLANNATDRQVTRCARCNGPLRVVDPHCHTSERTPNTRSPTSTRVNLMSRVQHPARHQGVIKTLSTTQRQSATLTSEQHKLSVAHKARALACHRAS